MLATASASPFYSSSTAGDVRLQYRGGRHSRAQAGSSTPPSSLHQQRLQPTAAIRSFHATAAGHAGVLAGVPLLVFAAPAGLLTWDGFGRPQSHLHRGELESKWNLPRFQVYHLSGTFSSPSQIYRNKSNENRKEKGEKKLLNSLARVCG